MPSIGSDPASGGDASQEPFGPFLDAWARWAGGRPVPDWSTVDILELPPARLDRVAVVDVVGDDPRDFVVRLAGETVQAMNGLRVRGLRLRDLSSNAVPEDAFAHYAACVLERRPLRARGTLVYRDRGFIGVDRLLLPFTRGGDAVAVILAVFEYGDVPA
jgi:hypothetical protein